MNVRAETTSELFADLNELRRINDKTPLKSWKDSKAKLLAAIASEEAEGLAPAPKAKKMTSGAAPVKAIDTDALTKAIEENKKANAKIAAPKNFAKNNVDQVKTPKAVKSVRLTELDAMFAPSKATKPVKLVPVKKARAVNDKISKPASEGVVNVSAICKELKLNPKVARATLRRKNVDRTNEAAVRAALKK